MLCFVPPATSKILSNGKSWHQNVANDKYLQLLTDVKRFKCACVKSFSCKFSIWDNGRRYFELQETSFFEKIHVVDWTILQNAILIVLATCSRQNAKNHQDHPPFTTFSKSTTPSCSATMPPIANSSVHPWRTIDTVRNFLTFFKFVMYFGERILLVHFCTRSNRWYLLCGQQKYWLHFLRRNKARSDGVSITGRLEDRLCLVGFIYLIKFSNAFLEELGLLNR